MRVGGFPGQQEALLELMRERQRMSRRRMFAVAGGALALGAGGGVLAGQLGRVTQPAPGTESDAAVAPPPEVQQARTLARGPLGELVRARVTFLAALRRNPEDAVLWHGFVRLWGRAELQAALADQVRALLATVAPPADFAPFCEDVRAALSGRGR